jgi:hypothetical protein
MVIRGVELSRILDDEEDKVDEDFDLCWFQRSMRPEYGAF